MVFASRDEKYIWTQHARIKARFYRLTESRIKRIIRHPKRIEEGILDGAVAAMQVAETKRYSEIWVMYVMTDATNDFEKLRRDPPRRGASRGGLAPPTHVGDHGRSAFQRFQNHLLHGHQGLFPSFLKGGKKLKIITAWRYPGKSPERDPIPPEILKEIRNIMY